MSSKPIKPAALDASKWIETKHAAVTLFSGTPVAICGSKTGVLTKSINAVNCKDCIKELRA